MVPKIIHYCWFGGKPLPASVKKCIASWKKYCPDYEIRQWNERNFDVACCDFTKEAMEEGRYAFVSDYARLKILEEFGGVYVDTDVELLRPLDELLRGAEGFMGFESESQSSGQTIYRVASGLGVACPPHHPAIRLMLEEYEGKHFRLEDGTLDQTPCPAKNTNALVKLGLRRDNTMQMIAGLRILPSDYLCPMDYQTHTLRRTKNTYSIHHYAMSWKDTRKKVFYLYQHVIHRVKQHKLGRGIIKAKKKLFALLGLKQ